MCMGESASDTLHDVEQQAIAQVAEAELPGHGVAFRRNDDGMAWVVLEPAGGGEADLRFTICRIAPCLVVMIEGGTDDRRFVSSATLAEAMDCVCAAVAGDGAAAKPGRLLQ